MSSLIVTAAQMGQIEERVFANGMPVAALMEKAAGRLADWIQGHYPQPRRVGVLVGPGHNGGDALVVARELHFQGYEVRVYAPFEHLKDLTATHARYVKGLGVSWNTQLEPLHDCDLFVDGLFGYGLDRPIPEPVLGAIAVLNSWLPPVISIDLPSGIHTDTGAVLGIAVRATHTLCLGLWKLGLFQEQALDYGGDGVLIELDIPKADIDAVLGHTPLLTGITREDAIAALPYHRPPVTHKYQQGRLLLIAGSRSYGGAAILAGLGARASGVGMLSLAVPSSLQSLVLSQLPEAVVIGCHESTTGAIAPVCIDQLSSRSYDAIACGPGLTTAAVEVVQWAVQQNCPLVLDADGLNSLSELDPIQSLSRRSAPTFLTPHSGEFKRLFPKIELADRVNAASRAAAQTNAIVILKGPRTLIARPDGRIAINPRSTPALARGGSGDVLTGILGGLVAGASTPHLPNTLEQLASGAVWWHAQAALLAAQECSMMGVDPLTLSRYLLPSLVSAYQNPYSDRLGSSFPERT
ncbi:MAG: NAD(P)H-hydrate dehydratase [Synechococcales bacterium]|nr:NAD(P)H-hydrate dehydratase [Synechococcales bacterium]